MHGGEADAPKFSPAPLGRGIPQTARGCRQNAQQGARRGGGAYLTLGRAPRGSRAVLANATRSRRLGSSGEVGADTRAPGRGDFRE